MAARAGLAAAALLLGCWGLDWCLPDRARVHRVLPPGADTPRLRAALEDAWHRLNERLGPDILLNPESWSYGFDGAATVEAGWSVPPPLLMSPARSFYLRSGHEDEPNLLRAVARLRPTLRGLNPRIYFYGGAYMYSLAGWIAAGAALTPARLVPDPAFYMEDPARMAWLYRLGRSFSAAAYLAVAGLIWWGGRRLFGEPAALMAAALWAAAPGVVLQAHYMKPHMMGTFFYLLAFLLCAETLRGGRPAWAAWAGAAGGLAMACASHLGTACLLPAATAALRLRQGRPWREEASWLAGAAALFVAAFLAATPYLLTEPATTLAAWREVGRFSAYSLANLAAFLAEGLPRGLGWPGALLAAGGLAWSLRRGDPVLRLAAVGTVVSAACFYILPSPSVMDSLRYFGGLPLVLLSAGAAAARLGRTGVALAGAAVLLAGARSAVLDYNLWLDRPGASTRDRAGDWIEANVPAGAELAMLRLPQPSNSPYFHWDRYRLRFYEPRVFAALPADASLPEWLALTHPTYDDRRAAGPTLGRYERVASFEPFSPPGLGAPTGQAYGNPLVEIYKRRPNS